MDLSSYFVEVLINRLFNVESIALDSIDVLLDLGQCLHSLLDLPITPNRLNAIGSSLLNDLIDWQLGSALSPLVTFVSILDS